MGRPEASDAGERVLAQGVCLAGTMEIFMFANRYPAPFKPYYDTQFVDLVERGHDLTIFSATSPAEDGLSKKVAEYDLSARTRRYPVSLRTIPLCVGAYREGGLRRPKETLAAARRMLSDGEGGGLRSWVRRLARLVAVQAGNPDLCLVHGLGTAVHLRWLRQAFPDTVVAMYYHGGEVPSVPDLDPDLVERTFGSFDSVLTNTRFSRDQAIDRGCAPGKLHVVPVGFDLSRFPEPSWSEKRQGSFEVVSAGRMSEEKGYIYALEGVRRLVEQGIDDVTYYLAGDGYTRADLEQYVHKHDLANYVRFLGVLQPVELSSLMSSADVILLTSVQMGNCVETQACAVQEGMLHGCIPVVSRIGGVPESIPADMDRFVVPQADSAEVAETLKAVYQLEVDEREQMGRKCRAWVQDNYDIGEVNRKLLSTIY